MLHELNSLFFHLMLKFSEERTYQFARTEDSHNIKTWTNITLEKT